MTKTNKEKEQTSSYRIIADDGALALYLKEISKYKALPIAEEAKLASRIRNGDQAALDKLVKSNLRFVISVSRNYQNQGLPLIDLINEGNLGLIRAASRFDEKKNFKFISYAVWWIRQAILQALAEQSRIVKLPLNRVGAIHKVGMAQSRLEQKFSRNPNVDEIADELKIAAYDVQEALKIGNTHFSLDAPLQSGEDSKLMDLLRDDRIESPDESVMGISLTAEVDAVLELLTDRERDVVKMYFGVGEETAYTLEEIGLRLDLTRERVRQIKERALKRLKNGSKSQRLNAYRKGS
ncbi:MAG: RNA polymerase sigma factor RpoD/SigA [Chitinispirillales bacterium]|jgi:RNA polymerase primary sigma factor|nr:RNA polymerase sigma factor RpoD/SigA [Chitinispirillales bacterium]